MTSHVVAGGGASGAFDDCALAAELGLVVEHGGNLLERAIAVFSSKPGQSYRYLLTRIWSPGQPVAVWIMLNPSTATAFRNDPTVGRCCGFTRQWGYGGAVILNAFALRSTSPRALYRHRDPVGQHNDRFLTTYASQRVTLGGPVIAAWGNHGALNGRAAAVRALLHDNDIPLQCLVLNATGQPGHPLYVKATTTLIPLEPPGSASAALLGSGEEVVEYRGDPA